MPKPVNNSITTSTQESGTQLPQKPHNVLFSRVKRRVLKHVWFVRLSIIAATLLTLFIVFQIFSVFLQKTGFSYYLNLARVFVVAPSDKVKSINGRTNILLLGKGGGSHEAPDLTDSIMFISISSDGYFFETISLPRDIWIPELRAKLNSVYYWGNQKQAGGGLILAKSTVEQILDEPIQYGLVLDFNVFKSVVDTLGGIKVKVEQSFVDERYPIPGKENDLCGGDPEYLCRYETISFKEGVVFMDGETALKYARSRNAEGDAGTDFARAGRQQEIIKAIREKLLHRDVLFSFEKIKKLIEIAKENIETDIEDETAMVLGRRALKAKNDVGTHVLPESFLVNPPYQPQYDNLYVFIPRKDSWEEVWVWTKCILAQGRCEVGSN